MARKTKQPDLAMTPDGRQLLLANMMKANKLTAAEVARRLKVTRPAVSRVIAGDLVSKRIRTYLASLAGLKVGQLFPPPPKALEDRPPTRAPRVRATNNMSK